jgi:CheY-like chemotaxis protein
MTTVQCTMLIDDDAPTNFYHTEVLRQNDFTKEILVYEEAQVALDYLNGAEQNEALLPNVIFLDLNMPGMDGWEFLHSYEREIAPKYPDIRLIVMLTTSENPDTREKAKEFKILDTFMSKPLTNQKLIDLSMLLD